MLELLNGILVAVLIAAFFYLFLEFRALRDVARQSGEPVSGAESAAGKQVTVIAAFEQSGEKQRLEGRIRLDGESWKAVLDADATTVPDVGDGVTVLEVDTARLVVRVK